MHQHFSNLTKSKIKRTYNVLQPPQFWSQNLKMRLVYSHASVFKDLSNYLFPMARFWTVTSGSFWLTTSLRLKPYLFDSTKGRLACFVDWNTSQLLAKAPAKRPKWQIAILLRFSVSVSITWFETTSYPGLLFPLFSGWETSDPGTFRLEVGKFYTSGCTAHAYLTNTLAVVLLPLIFIVFKTNQIQAWIGWTLDSRLFRQPGRLFSASLLFNVSERKRERESTRGWRRESERGA